MKEKRYILLTQTDSKYEDFKRYHFKLFDNYRELQKHLLRFWNEPVFYVFEETNIKKDKSLKIRSKYLK